MNRLFLLVASVFLLSSPSLAAESAEIGCKRLNVALDSRLSASIVEQDWASGTQHDEAPAILELRGCDGELLDRATLEAPLARIDPRPLHGTSAPTFLVSVDLTQSSGSYNGPLTIPFEIVQNHLKPAMARGVSGREAPIKLALTGKAAWKRVSNGKGEDLLAVNCEPHNKGFVINYRRYHPGRGGWTVRERSVAGLWESDSAFPASRKFP